MYHGAKKFVKNMIPTQRFRFDLNPIDLPLGSFAMSGKNVRLHAEIMLKMPSSTGCSATFGTGLRLNVDNAMFT